MAINDDQRRALARIELLDPAMAQVLSSKSPAERLAIANGMWRSARDMLRNLLRSEHPEWSQQEVETEAARRLSSGAR